MAEIQLLDKQVVEQIAAGEVIERPASIVKELLENAIDAGATRIDIQLDGGGLTSLRIVDNGCGIAQEQLVLAVTRHATSKIRKAEDLYSIGTMGFRSEALASVAAASRLTLASSDIGDGMGWQIKVMGGVVGDIEPVQHLKGTTIEVKDLFFNLPARKKFLKTERAEKMAVMRVVEQVFLAFPGIHFTCSVDGEKKYDIAAVPTPRLRISQVAGSDFGSKLIHCRAENSDMCADIYISEPDQARSRPRFQNLYVNLRKIESDSVLYAIREAFSRFISGHLKPSWFCFLDIDPSRIDVNVHPTKQKIKFDDEKALFSFIFHGVEKGITSHREKDFKQSTSSTSQLYEGDATTADLSVVTYEPKHPSSTLSTHEPQRGTVITGVWGEQQQQVEVTQLSHKKEVDASQTALPLLSTESRDIGKDRRGQWGGGALWDSISCYQIHNRYIVAPVKEGVLIIDQHAAHERVLYERVLKDLETGGVDSQRLIFPETIELKPNEKEALLEMRELFEKTGFDIQDFGGNTIAVSAVPATGFVKSTQIKDAIEEMLNQYIEESDSNILGSIHRKFSASYACGAAIKFGHTMPDSEMHSLLGQLFSCENPHICPHGRPTFTKLTLEELSKRFLR